ncbi:YceI family protein [Patescibacteria group bacterium]|nr:MAG: YceI family protein [Patescibacteria group bacterium]
MNKTITTVVIIVVIILAAFFYFTRPVSAPTESVESVAEKLVPTSQGDVDARALDEKLYRVSKSQSQVQFSINEVLRGSPFTAVGRTSEVAGDFLVSNRAVKVGTMTVNAKTFKTDSTQRDGAIVRFILKSDQPANEFITFKPSQPIALALPLAEGKQISANLSGDLTISGVTKPAIFAVRVQIQNQKLLVTGETIVKRSDFNLKIPELSFIASVDDEVGISVSTVAEMIQ